MSESTEEFQERARRELLDFRERVSQRRAMRDATLYDNEHAKFTGTSSVTGYSPKAVPPKKPEEDEQVHDGFDPDSEVGGGTGDFDNITQSNSSDPNDLNAEFAPSSDWSVI